MTTKRILSAAFVAAVFATIYLPTGKLSAQGLEEYSDDQLDLVLNYGQGSSEVHLGTHHGVAEPVSLRPDQWFPFALRFPMVSTGSTVMMGCLDGGEIIAITAQGQAVSLSDSQPDDLSVSADGTMHSVSGNGTWNFSFKAGQTLGLYRVVVQLPGKRYYLHFYLVDPTRPRTGIGGAILP